MCSFDVIFYLTHYHLDASVYVLLSFVIENNVVHVKIAQIEQFLLSSLFYAGKVDLYY